MRCPDHPRELVPSPDGQSQRCPFCQGELKPFADLEQRSPGLLAAESRQDSLAFKKVRRCPACEVPMAPWRIGKVEAWVERCPQCEQAWVEPADVRTLTMLSKSHARQSAFSSMSAAEKQELAGGLAEATAQPTGPDVGLAGAALVMAGVPLLDRVEGSRTPLATFGLAVAMVAVFASGLAWPQSLSPDQLAYPAGSGEWLKLLSSTFAHFGWLHLLGNLGFLLVFGDAVEQKLPRGALALGFVLLCPLTIGADALVSPAHELIGGASGGIAGLIAMAVVLQPKARVMMFFGGGGAGGRPLTVPVPLWGYGVLWAVVQVIFWSLGVPGVAWASHLCGFLMGLGLGLAVKRSAAA